ncbi:MAG: alpha/beta hydrolase [Silicimonas sp.]|nr:alpha/beta hydrolase [Silicimonas sp.]
MFKSPEKSGGVSFIARKGNGPDVVFLHGIGSNAVSFQPLFESLPENLNLVAWNAPGYLGSEPLEEPWPLAEDYAYALARMLDGLDLSSVHLVGHSLGTLIAASFARLFPDRVRGLVLASAACGHGVPRGGEMPQKVRARIDDLHRLGPEAFARARAANLVHRPEANEAIVTRVEAAMATVNPGGYEQAVRLLASGDLCGDLKHVPVRPGFIIGAEDRVTPLDQTNAAAAAWEAAYGRRPTVKRIEGAGHAVYLQKPGEFCAALSELLEFEGAAALEMSQSHGGK